MEGPHYGVHRILLNIVVFAKFVDEIDKIQISWYKNDIEQITQ